jgi:adenylate cyclase
MIRQLANFGKSPIVRWVSGVTLLMLVLVIWRPTFTEFMDLKLYDLKFRFRGARPASPEVAIVAIDDDSLKAVGRWPWSREQFAQLVTRLNAAQPRVIALDVIFAEKQETEALRALANLQRECSRYPVPREVLELLDEARRRADVDRVLREALKGGPPTVLGFYFRDVGGMSKGLQPANLMESSFIRASTYNLVRSLDTAPSQVPLMGAGGVELNLPEITAVVAADGYFNMVPDADGVVRWYPMSIIYGSDFFAPLSLVTLAQYSGRPPLAITLSQLGVEEIRLGGLQVPVDRFGRMLINYLGPPGKVATYSAKALMDGTLPAGTLKDKIVLVGATAVGIYDLRVTPFSGIFPGVEIQATVLDNLLRQNFIRTPRLGLPLMLVIILGLGILMGLTLPRLSAIWAFIFTLVLLESYITVNYLLFSRAGLQIEVLYPVVEIVAVYLGITVQRFLMEERERVRVKKAFESYVAPAVVQEMLKHPEQLRLGGERRELTILFSDIRGFTTISENLEPQALVSLLHDFLNPMSNIIINQGGTIDKYMGDAIMALFGAPLIQPEHARLACRAALAMAETLRDLNQQWTGQGRPPLKIGIGVNTGPVAVGNMGSDRLFDYTAVGDNVNLASRLEGLNKYYGTKILISQTTAEALGEGFILRDVDRVRVKGKAQAAQIFEILGEGDAPPELARFLALYHQGLSTFRQQQWSEGASLFQQALDLRPEDGAAQRYLTLSRQHEQSPPPPGWEAVTTMDGK